MEINESKRNTKRIVLSVGMIVLAMAVAALCTANFYRKKYERLLPIGEAMSLVENNYYFYEQNEVDLQTTVLRGIAANIGDDYAQYFTEDEYQQLLESNSGVFYGIGISVVRQDIGQFFIHAVFEDSPAEEAGIAVGDRLISINGVLAEGLEMSEFLDNFNHDEGYINTVVVEREGREVSFSVEMREVYSPYVFHEMLDDEIGYILITGFQGECVSEVDAAIEDLQSKGMKKLILDLRDNLGGSLNIVTEVAGYFLPEDSIITTVKSRTEAEEVYRTYSEGISVPMAVLVNNYSASASELLSGALSDHGRAKLFGEVTYGKGIVQSYYHLSGNNGYLKFTSDAYYTPNGVCIQGTGIEPDVKVALDEKWANTAISLIPHEEDNQLQTALEYLKKGE